MRKLIITRFSLAAVLAGLMSLVAAAALGVSAGASGQATPASEVVAGETCADRAEPLTGPPWSEGEPSVVVPRGAPDRRVAIWTTRERFDSGFGSALPGRLGGRDGKGTPMSPITGSIVLAQRDPLGQWSMEVVSHFGRFGSGDPWIAPAANGSVYAAYLARRGAVTNELGFVRRVVPGKPAGEEHFTGEQFIDHPALAVDPALRRPEDDRLYLVEMSQVWRAAILSISNDGGKTWGDPVVRFPKALKGFLPYYQLAPVIASGGETVVVAWSELKNDDPDNLLTAIRVAPFDRRTEQFGKPTTVALMAGAPAVSLPFGSSAIPSLSVVEDEPDAGRAYISWPERRGVQSSLHSDVYVRASDDGGYTWSPPRRVNSDPAADSYHVYPSVAARPDGKAVVAWLDTRDYPDNDRALLYAAVVEPRGAQANLRLTDCPTFGEASFQTLGDYFNFDAHADEPVLVFPNIRRGLGTDSDVLLLEGLQQLRK